jgi:bacillolysin
MKIIWSVKRSCRGFIAIRVRSVAAALTCIVALLINERAVAQGTVAEADRGEFAKRAGEMLRSLKPNTRVKAQAAQAGAPRQAIANAGEDVEVHLRPGVETVMQLRGAALAKPLKTGSLTALADSRERTAREFFANQRALLRLTDPEQELTLLHKKKDEQGHEHLRFGQRYKGLVVWPGELSAHFDQTGNLKAIDGAYAPTPELESVTPKLNGEEAVASAKASIAPGKNATAAKLEPIVYAPLRDRARLAWKFELTVSLLEGWVVVVDAQDGSILHRSTLVFDGQVQGAGVDLFGVTRELNVWQQGATYYMADTSKRSYNAAFDPVTNPRGVISIGDAKGRIFDDVLRTASADLVTAATPNGWGVPATVSAAFNLSQVFDYYSERHQRNSLDGQGGNLTAIVGITGYDNACWVGNLGLMLFGDNRPWAGSLDIVGHELAHGVTYHNVGLPHENQTGALSEALSDIFGEMIEARTFGQNDWLIGTAFGMPLRNLKNPGALFNFDRRYPARMSEYLNDPNDSDHDFGGVHVNATIIGHAFYLMAEGLPGALGPRAAESIVYRCVTHHLFALSQFIDYRLGCVLSAEELFGKDSTEARLTARAFDAVEIYATPSTPEPTPLPAISIILAGVKRRKETNRREPFWPTRSRRFGRLFQVMGVARCL